MKSLKDVLGNIQINNVDLNKSDIVLSYDDRFLFESEVVNINMQIVLSKQTGEKKADEAVLQIDETDSRKVIACGCGSAEVLLKNGKTYTVEVNPAKISLVLIAGQSNGEGRIADNIDIETVKKQFVLNPEGQVYTTYGISDYKVSKEVIWIDQKTKDLSIYNYRDFLPNSLTDNKVNTVLSFTNRVTDSHDAIGKGGIESAFAYKWNEILDEKIWIVNAAHHGSSILEWQPGDSIVDNEFWQAVKLYQGAEKLLSKEIEAGHYILSHKGILWCQGEKDYEINAEQYLEYFDKMQESFFHHLNGKGIKNLEKPIEFMGILMIRAAMGTPRPDNDFLLTGPRVAQYYISRDKERPEIFLASHIEEIWVDDKSVENYFLNRYDSEEQFNKLYPTYDNKKKLPATIDEVDGGFHYSQIAYNEMGFDAAVNVCSSMEYISNKKQKVELVQVVMEDGVTDVSNDNIEIEIGKDIPFAVKVFPACYQKEIEIEGSDNIKITPLGLQLTNANPGKIKIKVGKIRKSITVHPQ